MSLKAQTEAKLIRQKDDGGLLVPDRVRIPVIPGDGIGPEIWRATRLALDEAISLAYGGRRHIEWITALAGEMAFRERGEYLPEETVDLLLSHRVSLKGPLTTPVGGGVRSLNVQLRQILDLYACIRPVKYIPGTPSPMKEPQKVDMVIFRENTEDVYSGIEWKEGSRELALLREWLFTKLGVEVPEDSGIGLKVISRYRTQRLVRMAIRYALQHNRSRITLVHKGNIMKYTEGAFLKWGYEVAEREFGDKLIREDEERVAKGVVAGRPVINDRLADNMFQQIILKPAEYDVLAMPNLNGDYLSDALAALVGGLGIAPGANVGDGCAVFEATHGSVPKYAGKDKVNPTSLMLSGALMLEFMGWNEAAELVRRGVGTTIQDSVVTYDLARFIPNAKEVSCSGFAQAVVERMQRSFTSM